LIIFSTLGRAYTCDDFIKERTTDQLNLLLKYVDLPTWDLSKYANPTDNYILESKEEYIDLSEPISIEEFFTK